ncbi:MAG: hypothetical protein ACJ72B_16975 [Ornithinibacter sp.]
MGRRPLLVMVLGWFAVVGAVGAITFVVVSNAGSGVGRASAAERVVVVPPQDSASPTVTSPGTPTPSVPPTASSSRPTGSTSAQPTRPTDTPDPRPTSKAPRPNPPTVDPRTASFSTEGGIVVATCRGARITVMSIRPRDDWRFGDTELERGALEVTFTTTGREVEVYLRCVDEVPTRLKPGAHRGAPDPASTESRSSQLVHVQERVQSEGLEHATPTPSPTSTSTPTDTPSSTEETPHG